jgi:hypothetical protein
MFSYILVYAVNISWLNGFSKHNHGANDVYPAPGKGPGINKVFTGKFNGKPLKIGMKLFSMPPDAVIPGNAEL